MSAEANALKQQEAVQSLFETFAKQYKDLSEFVRTLPLSDNVKSIVLKALDDAFLWGKEGFLHIKTDAVIEPISLNKLELVEPEDDEPTAA